MNLSFNDDRFTLLLNREYVVLGLENKAL